MGISGDIPPSSAIEPSILVGCELRGVLGAARAVYRGGGVVVGVPFPLPFPLLLLWPLPLEPLK